jgi:hypothetical protein
MLAGSSLRLSVNIIEDPRQSYDSFTVLDNNKFSWHLQAASSIDRCTGQP